MGMFRKQTISSETRVFERKVSLSRLALLFERLWPRVWLVIAVVGVFVLASFAGTLQNGESTKVEMTSYAAKADPKLFELPKGAKIIDAAGTPTG